MAVSKNKRKNGKTGKKYVQKQVFSPYRLRQCDLEQIKDDFRKFEMICEMKLPTGNATVEEMRCLRDFFNVTKIILLFPEERYWLDAEAIAQIADLIETASVAVREVTIRGTKTGHCVCKADELNAIRDFAEIAGDVVQKSIELCPRRFIKKYLAMKDLTRDKIGRVRLTEKIVKQAIDRYTNDVRGAMKQSALNPANRDKA